ncbi:MAG: hypothetical protein JWO31_195 [Phycisphaerales bacterium]|nr:hypothetical protein [Phycisphaerales bacterium]
MAVQYLDGVPDGSRLAGHTNQVWLLVSFASLAFVGFNTFQLVRASWA